MEHRDAGFEKRKKAREKYKPKKVEWLLVAEAPPGDLNRYFYFDTSSAHDDLFREVIHAIYRYEFPEISVRCRIGNRLEDRKPNTRMLRQWKPEFLCQFEKDGFHLIDAIDCPISEADPGKSCEEIVEGNLLDLVARMSALATKDTRVILIKASVCALQDQLSAHDFRVINNCMIPFPNQNHQKEFRREMQRLLQPHFEKRKEERLVRSLARC